MATQGTRWLSSKEGGVEIALPLSPPCAARVLGHAAKEAAPDRQSSEIFAALLDSLTEIYLGKDRALVRMGPREGFVRFHVQMVREPSEPGQQAVDLKVPEKLASRAEVIRVFSGD